MPLGVPLRGRTRHGLHGPSVFVWLYRKSHVINAAANAGVDYQVRIIVHYGSGVDSGEDVYCDRHCRTDFGDIRFTSSDKITQLNYWIESKVDGDNAVFWVKVLEDLSLVNRTIYIYYGKSDAATTSNIVNTFIFADDFELNNFSRWTTAEDRWSIVSDIVKERNYGGKAVVTAYGQPDRTLSKTQNQGNQMIEGWCRTSFESGLVFYVVVPSLSTGQLGYFLMMYFTRFTYGDVDGVYDFPNLKAFSKDTWYRFKVGLDFINSKLRVWINGDYLGDVILKDYAKTILNADDYTTSFSVLGGWCPSTSRLDPYFVRKFVYPEPSHGAWGEEEHAT